MKVVEREANDIKTELLSVFWTLQEDDPSFSSENMNVECSLNGIALTRYLAQSLLNVKKKVAGVQVSP